MMNRSGTGWRTRGTRRAVVLAWAAVFVALVLRALFGDSSSGLDTVWLLTVGTWVALWAVLRSMTRSIAEGPASELDERELALRSRFLPWGYYVALVGGLLVAFYLIAAHHTIADGAMRGAQLLLAVLGAGIAAPTVAYAWVAENEPEDESEDDLEDESAD